MLHPTGDTGATPGTPPNPHDPITYPYLPGSQANVMAGRAHVEALGLPVDRLAALGEYVAGHQVGRILADELIRTDRGPTSFPWPALTVTYHRRKGDPRDVLVTVTAVAPGNDGDPVSVTVHPAMLNELMEAAEERWHAHLDATRTEGDWITYRRECHERVEEMARMALGPRRRNENGTITVGLGTIVGRGWN